jgi:hypothetical protein
MDSSSPTCRLEGRARLPEIGCNERTKDPEYGGENKAGRFVVTRHDELGSYACYKSDYNRPQMPMTHLQCPDCPKAFSAFKLRLTDAVS